MAIFNRAKTPRGVRPELPAPTNATIWHGNTSWGPVTTPYVASSQALALPAAWRAVNLIANGVASMTPAQVVANDGVTTLSTPSVVARPLATETTFSYFHSVTASLVLTGDFIGLKADFGADGYPQQVVPLPSELVSVSLSADGYLIYGYGGHDFAQDEVVHIRLFSQPGYLRGVGVVENARRSLSASLDLQGAVADSLQAGIPAGVIQITSEQEVSPEQAQSVKDMWADRQGQRRGIAVLPNSMEFKPLSFSARDQEFIAALQNDVAAVALMFGLSPSDLEASLGGAGTLTYSNREQRVLDRISDVFMPLGRRIEEAWSDLIPGGNSVRFDPSQLLRTDSLTRAQVAQLNVGSGVMTKDEARATYEGLPPLTDAQKSEQAITAPTPVPGSSLVEEPVSVKA